MLSSIGRFLSLLIAAVVGGIIATWFLRPAAPPQPSAAAPQFYASPEALGVEVTEMPAAARVELGGYVEPRDVVRLTAQAPGRITYTAGQEGDRVGAGQVVAAVDDDALQPEYRAAWANLTSDTIASQNAQTQLYHRLYGQPTTSPMGGPAYDAYERSFTPFYNMAQSFMGNMMPGASATPYSPFGGSNMPLMTQQQSQRSYPAINSARADYERQLAGLVGSQSRIDALDARARDLRAITPRAGVILRRFVRLGDAVQPGQPVADIGDVDALDVRLEVPVAQVAQVKLNDPVPVTVNGANLWATVRQIFPSAEGPQRTVTVKLALPPGAAVAPGMYARAWIAQPGGGGPSMLTPAVPTNAIAYRGSLPIAFVSTNRGVEMRVLRLGDSMGDRTAVLSGLRAGERVLVNPPPDLKAAEASSGGQ